jgi:hypothetical protein
VRSERLVKKLMDFLQTHEIEWSRLWKLQLWVLYMGAMETHSVNDRMWFAKAIAVLLQQQGIMEWNEGFGYVKVVLWLEKVFGRRDWDLGTYVDSLLISMI